MEQVKNVLLIPGYGQPHPDRWQYYEKRYAEEKSLHVVYPDVPEFNEGNPTVEMFRTFISDLLQREGLEPDKTAVLAHSMGGSGWLHMLETRKDLRQCLTWLIGTPKEDLTGVSEVNDFFPVANPDLSKEEKGRIIVVGSMNDHVINEPPTVLADYLDVTCIMSTMAGHFMPHVLSGANQKRTLNCGSDWMRIRDNFFLPY